MITKVLIGRLNLTDESKDYLQPGLPRSFGAIETAAVFPENYGPEYEAAKEDVDRMLLPPEGKVRTHDWFPQDLVLDE
jgi:hypothetical protein